MGTTPQWALEKIQEAKEKRLKKLDLNGYHGHQGKLTEIPAEVFGLTWLAELNLDWNQITTVPYDISQLHHLTTLKLHSNQITTVPDAITQLHHLKALDLGRNKITTVPDAITQLYNLEALGLGGNQITTVPDAIIQLHHLTELDLGGNQITKLPNEIAQLHNLSTLSLSNNQITTIPESITRLQKLNRLDLDKNLIETPPLEVVEKGIDAIREYYRQIETQGTEYLYEAKLLIVGEGGAGKTTLAQKIQNPNYQLQKDEDTTRGIEVIKWQFPLTNGRNFQVNIWDFGGQQIYHSTHQFFLTKRSLYVLVADNRQENTNFSYWLEVVKLLSDNSPFLIIQNEKNDRTFQINEPQLRGRFTNLKEILPANFATNRGLEKVLREIQHQIVSLPHVGTPLPKTWVKVRRVLETNPANYISLDEYLQICQENGFTRQQDKLQLSSYLHDLGVFLHFQDDPILYNTIILKPKWGTDAVYRVLDDRQIIQNYGKFTWKDLQRIWQEPQYATKQGELLQLMINFQLCYEIPNSSKTYIAPQLLSETQPKYQWDENQNLLLRYTYEFMPKGIITQLIVAMHNLIDGQKYVWKSGVILSQDETKAEVIEFYDLREIKIRVTGKYKRDLMIRVMYEVDKIHGSYKELKFTKLIPCNCQTCKGNQDPHFYRYEDLRKRIADRRYNIECYLSYQEVSVLDLIDDVMDKNELMKEEEKRGDIYIEVNNGQIGQIQVIKGNNNMTNQPQPEETTKSKPEITLPFAFRNGMFYLFIFVVVFSMIAFFGGSLPIHYLAITIISTALFIVLIGALQLHQDNRLSEKSFMELIKMVIEQLPLIGNVVKQLTSKDK
jgi:GTPase SAR1 family protein